MAKKKSLKRTDVLDKGFVELLDVMGDDLAIVNAARVSYLGESKGGAADKKLLFYLMEHHHSSPFEQVELKFRVKAPLMVFWQWVRHRTFHYQHINSQSGRYTPFNPNDVYVPIEWRAQDVDNKQGSNGRVDRRLEMELTQTLQGMIETAMNTYQVALQAGVAKEQARLFLPAFGLYYTWIVKVDAWNLMHFLKLRLADEAQWEIRQYAEAIRDMFAERFPWAYEAFEKYMLGETEDDETSEG